MALEHNYKSVNAYFKEYKEDFPKLTDYECLNLALKQQQNDILKVALGVPALDSKMSFLEKIAKNTDRIGV